MDPNREVFPYRPDAFSPASGAPLSVAELTASARQLIERNMPLVWVTGELSNFTRAPSGHCYFSLKDARAQVSCVLFRSRAQLLDWMPGTGMQVEVRAAPSLYEPRGEFQLTIDTMRQAGSGALYERFAKLKARLEREGLFEAQRKRPLPAYPRRLGVVTSPRGAALQDVLTTLARRMPGLPIIIYPSQVQGDAAAAQLVHALGTASVRRDCDVLLLCRGGGSIEDLWCFNDERVARAVATCAIPVVTGVGHETDFTIVDFVADARAPTPTAAAALASPDRAELVQRLTPIALRLQRCARHGLQQRIQQVDFLARRLVHPEKRILEQGRELAHLGERLNGAFDRGVQARTLRFARLAHAVARAAPPVDRLEDRCRHLGARLRRGLHAVLERHRQHVASLGAQLGQLSPDAVLSRGYSIAAMADGTIVRDARQLSLGDRVDIGFAAGRASATVTETKS
jgi:exodeoxyribonuclease VII large subunit